MATVLILVLGRSTNVEVIVHDCQLIVQKFGHKHFNIRPIIINI
jgi:hypothetical protein